MTHDPYSALRYRDYRLLWCGGVLAGVGGEVQAVVVGWELYDRTHSAAYLGLAGLAQFLPVLLLALPAGQAADRYSRKGLFQAAQVAAVLASLGLASLSFWNGPVELVFACLLLAGVGRAVSAPARSALLTQVVAPPALGNAVTWNSSGWQFANMAGPALGGALYAIAEWCAVPGQGAPAYVAAALCSLACVLLLIPIRPRETLRPVLTRSLGSLLAGVRFVGRTELLLAAITLDLFAVLLGGATALLPMYAKDILHVGPLGLGALRAAPAIGAMLTAVWLAHRPPLARPGRALLAAVAGFGLATIVFGLSSDVFLSFALLAATGALDNVSVVVRGTLMQTLTPDDMRGRVAAVNTVFISSSNELGAFESGTTAWLFGPIVSVVGGGVGTLLVVLLVAWRWPRLLGLGPLRTAPIADATAAEAAAEEEAALDGATAKRAGGVAQTDPD